MTINPDQQYFLMSFRFDKKTPADFGLVSVPEQDDLFISTHDNSRWKKKELYDFGWGNENGFVRQPELGFDALWYLLSNSEIQENEYGAASELLERFPENLLGTVEQFLGHGDRNLEPKQKKALMILKLDQATNRCPIIGKSYAQISQDFARWEAVSQKVTALKNLPSAIQSSQTKTPSPRDKRPWWKFW
ncbi:hypothetical protein [Methylomonas rapida]|uniref:Uncharacterized protein n=1 Tax=Methylomonas rapida TaxID=2963939 RepID=A0ABY7GDX8_9GAMM|nr:hypothetical protein [Methylomonas rapida]WAR43492.1 hypothetical protein NM686_014025 [Methylomonas rapida]